jgi:GNAT superfamily N-acetyltransferase
MVATAIVIRPLAPGEVDVVGARLGLARLAEPDGAYLVAWDGDQPVGHAHLTRHDPPRLQDVEVHPDAQRRGVARQLVAAAAVAAAARGATTLRLEVSATNDVAHALYRSCGFVDTGVPPRRVTGTIQIRTGPIEVDDVLWTWELPLGPGGAAP